MLEIMFPGPRNPTSMKRDVRFGVEEFALAQIFFRVILFLFSALFHQFPMLIYDLRTIDGV